MGNGIMVKTLIGGDRCLQLNIGNQCGPHSFKMDLEIKGKRRLLFS